jgi:hypothetical protein
MEICYLCRRPLLEIEICRRVMPVAHHRGVIMSGSPGLLSSTSYAPISLCPACDAVEEQRNATRKAQKRKWLGRICLGLLLVFSIGDLVKGQNHLIAILGLLFISGYIWRLLRAARSSTALIDVEGESYGTAKSTNSD